MNNRLFIALQVLWVLLAVFGGLILFYLVASAVVTRWLGF